MSEDLHAFALGMEDGLFWLTVDCPYDRGDEARPCWPHTEDGERETAPQVDCTYEGWVDALTVDEILHGSVSIPLPTARAVWADGLEVHVAGVDRNTDATASVLIPETETP